MKTIIYISGISILLLFILTLSCGKKKAEETFVIKRELAALHQTWETSQTRLRANMEIMKNDLKEYGELYQDLSRVNSVNHSKMKQLLYEIQADLDALRKEMEILNAYIHEWNEQSKSLNKLVQQVEAKEIKPDEAKTRIAELSTFVTTSQQKLEHIDNLLKQYTVNTMNFGKDQTSATRY